MANPATSYTNAIEEQFSTGVQRNLSAMLVSAQVTGKEAQSALAGGSDTYNKPYIPRGQAGTYTKYTDITPQAHTATNEQLVVSTFKYYDFSVDRLDSLQLEKAAAVLAHQQKEAAFALNREIDAEVWAEYSNANYKYTGGAVSTSSTVSGTTLTSGNVDDVFGEVGAHLRNLTGGMNGLYAVIDPEQARFVEQAAITNGFNLADSTFQNGYSGDFLGFKVYVSTNLPSAISLNLATNPTDGDTFTINGVTFTFVDTLGAVAGNVHICSTAAATVDNLVVAFNDLGTAIAEATDTGYVAISASDRSRLPGIAATDGTTSLDLTGYGRFTVSETLTDGTDTWGTQVIHSNFGEFGAIEQAVQQQVATMVTPREFQIGDLWKTYTASGAKTFNDGADRFVDVQLG
jgi:hypothetical protein